MNLRGQTKRVVHVRCFGWIAIAIGLIVNAHHVAGQVPSPEHEKKPQTLESPEASNSDQSLAPKSLAPQEKPKKARRKRTYKVDWSVAYDDVDSKKLRADVYRPAAEAKQGRPAILMIHGGGWRSGNRRQMSGHARFAVTHGYVAVCIDYRLAPEHRWPAQIHDCKAALRWMRLNAEAYGIDPDRIAAYGYSAGGHLASLLGTTKPADGLDGTSHQPDKVSTQVMAVVAGGAPCDFRIVPSDSRLIYYWLGSTRHQEPARYEVASPAYHASPDDAPSFFFHGKKDWIVPVWSSQRMSDELRKAGVDSEHYAITGKGHILCFMERSAMRRAIEFLDRHMKPSPPDDQLDAGQPASTKDQ